VSHAQGTLPAPSCVYLVAKFRTWSEDGGSMLCFLMYSINLRQSRKHNAVRYDKRARESRYPVRNKSRGSRSRSSAARTKNKAHTIGRSRDLTDVLPALESLRGPSQLAPLALLRIAEMAQTEQCPVPRFRGAGHRRCPV
jgi:hypothetical protein